jgi:hypothetical protein
LHLLPEGFVRIGNFDFLANRKKERQFLDRMHGVGRYPRSSSVPLKPTRLYDDHVARQTA